MITLIYCAPHQALLMPSISKLQNFLLSKLQIFYFSCAWLFLLRSPGKRQSWTLIGYAIDRYKSIDFCSVFYDMFVIFIAKLKHCAKMC